MNMKWNSIDHRHEVYNHSGFQMIVSIQFVVFLLESLSNGFNISYFLCLASPILLNKGQPRVRSYCKILRKRNLSSVHYLIFFCNFLNRFKEDFVASSLFSVKAFRYFCRNYVKVICLIVPASFFSFFFKFQVIFAHILQIRQYAV